MREFFVFCLAASSLFANPISKEGPACPTECNPCLTRNYRCPNRNGANLQVDFLWWRADEENLGFATITEAFIQNVQTDLSSIERFDFDWDPGFRATIGWNTCHDEWDLVADWTWYKNHTQNAINASVNDLIGINATWLVDSAEGIAETSASWRFLENLGTLKLRKVLSISPCFQLRFLSGIEGGFLNRRFQVNYGQSFIFEPDAPGVTKAKSNYWGLGPLFGLENQWKLGYGFHILGNFIGSLLYGKVYENRVRVVQEVNGGMIEIQTGNILDEGYMKLLPHIRLILGIGFEKCTCRDLLFSLNCGWEANLFWNVKIFTPIASNFVPLVPNHTIVSTAGLILNGAIQF